MDAIVIQNVSLPLGINLLDVIVLNVVTSSWRKKSVVAENRLYVAMVTTKKKRLNKNMSPESKFQALFSKGLTKFIKMWETSN